MHSLPLAIYSRNPSKPPLTASRYWRVLITDSNIHAALGQLDMAGVVDGPSLCVGGTPSASSVYPGTMLANIFDGNPTEPGWAGNESNGKTGWVQYTFPSPVIIVQMRMIHRLVSTGQSPRNFQIQKSDNGSTWTTTATYSDITAWGNVPTGYNILKFATQL